MSYENFADRAEKIIRITKRGSDKNFKKLKFFEVLKIVTKRGSDKNFKKLKFFEVLKRIFYFKFQVASVH